MKTLGNIKKVEKIFEKAIKDASELGYELVFDIETTDVVDVNGKLYEDSLWYGGSIFSLRNEKENKLIEVKAVGDIDATLIRKYDDDILIDFKDTRNTGYFRYELSYYIKGDKELLEAENGKNEEYDLIFNNNNWFECFVSKLDDYGDYYSDVVDGELLSILEDIKSLVDFANLD